MAQTRVLLLGAVVVAAAIGAPTARTVMAPRETAVTPVAPPVVAAPTVPSAPAFTSEPPDVVVTTTREPALQPAAAEPAPTSAPPRAPVQRPPAPKPTVAPTGEQLPPSPSGPDPRRLAPSPFAMDKEAGVAAVEDDCSDSPECSEAPQE